MKRDAVVRLATDCTKTAEVLEAMGDKSGATAYRLIAEELRLILDGNAKGDA